MQTALGSVIRLCAAGKRIVFDDDDDDEGGGYIEDKRTGRRTKIIKEDGMYIVNLYIPKGDNKKNIQTTRGFSPTQVKNSCEPVQEDYRTF